MESKLISALEDIATLSKMCGDLKSQMPEDSNAISDPWYLQCVGLAILLISKFEFLMKLKHGIRQCKLIEFIESLSYLTQLEKDHLIYLIIARHAMVHNGERADDKMLSDLKKHVKKLKWVTKKDEMIAMVPWNLETPLSIVRKILTNEFKDYRINIPPMK